MTDEQQAAAPPVKPVLESLQKRELVFRHTPSSFSNSDEFIFKHALLRDVAYETVLLKHRKRFHSQVALWLEVNAGERLAEYLGLIANHFELAGEGAKAARYLRKQANALYLASSYRDALVLYQRSLDMCPQNDRRQQAVICIHLGNTMRQLSDFGAAREYQNRALQLSREISDQQTEINSLDGLGWALMGQGRYDEAKKHLDLALAIALRFGDKIGNAKVLYHLGEVSYRQGNSQATAGYGEECLSLCQELKDKQGIAGALRVIGFSYFMRGQYQESFHYHTQSKSVYSQIGERWGVASGLTNQGESMRRQGKLAEAEPYYLESQKVYEEIGSRLGWSISLLNLGHVHTGLRNGAQAMDYFRRSGGIAMEIGAYSVILEVLAGVALLEAQAGRFDRAAEILGAVQTHHEYNDEIRANSEPVFNLINQSISPREMESSVERGRKMEIEPLIKDLLAKP